jgi:hypothetical protein
MTPPESISSPRRIAAKGEAMSERETYEEAKKTLAEVHHILATEALTEKERRELQVHAARLAGVISRPWLPVSWGRRLIMVGIVALGAQQALWVGNYEPLAWWLLLPLFSPRIMGYGSYYLGRLARPFRS